MAIETLLSLYRQAGHEVPSVPAQAIVPRRRGSAYDASGSGHRGKGWLNNSEGINSLLFANAETLRNRSRDAVRKNPWAANALDSYTGNAIGAGIKPMCLYDDKEVRFKVHKAWRRWTDESDFYGQTDFYGQQSLAFRSMMEAGEVLIRMRVVPDRGLTVPLQFQILEAEHLPLNTFVKPAGVADGNEVRSGIEVDGEGRRVAYHIYREHPGETSFFSPKGRDMVRVPATEMLHIFRPLRPGQLRGQPWLTQVLVTLYELDQYSDAALVRKKISSLLAGFVKKPDLFTNDVVDGEPEEDDETITSVELKAGTLYNLGPGEDITWTTTPDESDFEAFVRSHLRAIAVGCGITYEQLTGDLTGVNYSSIRAGLLEFRRKCELLQYQVVVYQMCRPIYRAWLDMAVLSGALELRYYSVKRADYQDVQWITPGWPWVDPLKDISASVMEIQHGLTSRGAVIASKGEDIEVIDAANDADKRRWPNGVAYGDINEEAKAARETQTDKLLNEPEPTEQRRAASSSVNSDEERKYKAVPVTKKKNSSSSTGDSKSATVLDVLPDSFHEPRFMGGGVLSGPAVAEFVERNGRLPNADEQSGDLQQ